jgi:hypothetical protein
VALFREQYRQVGGIEIEACVGRLAANVPTYAGNETFRKNSGLRCHRQRNGKMVVQSGVQTFLIAN